MKGIYEDQKGELELLTELAADHGTRFGFMHCDYEIDFE